MRHYDYYKPGTLEEAIQLKKAIPGSMFIAGGTDIMVQVRNREHRPPALISLRSIPGLNSIEMNGGARIRALTAVSDIISHSVLGKEYPGLVQAARKLGSVQVRNVATIGGNLCNCSPCADLALPLLVLEARVRIRSEEAEREIPLTEFFRGPGQSCLASDEVLTEILLDPPPQKARTIFLKKGRVHIDLAIASVAILLVIEGEECLRARIAAGSVAPVPLRLYEVEELLESGTLTLRLVRKAQRLAAECVSPITDIRSTEEYRRQVVGVYVKRGLGRLLGWEEA